MPSNVGGAAPFLFVPGDRPDRLAKAFGAGAPGSVLLRVAARGRPYHDADAAPASRLALAAATRVEARVANDAAQAAELGSSGRLLIRAAAARARVGGRR